jgi:molecular chaperone DnaK (HSP70)
MTVVGIDFGNETVVVAVAANRGVDVVLNMACNRATPVFITFSKRGGRLFGDVSRESHLNHAACTVSNLKRLIGRRYDDPVAQLEYAKMTIRCVETPDGMLTCIIPVHNITETSEIIVEYESFTPIELLAAFLSYIRHDASKSLRTDVSECVLSCPTFFKQSQRLALLDAARIAKWRVMRLLNETTAALVAYGMPRKWEEIHTVAIVDVGHAHLQVSVARIHATECDVLSYVHDEHVGGRGLDELMARLVDEGGEPSQSRLLSSMPPAVQKGRLRVLQECEKAKRVLSTNKDVRLLVECVPDADGNLRDIDVRITREQFETKASTMRCAIHKAILTSLSIAGVDRVDTVELVGGSSRAPCIISCIADAFSQAPKRTLDSSECVAKGCALFAAMLSPRYQARPFAMLDIFIYEISLCFAEKVEMIYKANTRLERTKKIALSIAPPAQLRCAYTDSDILEACTVEYDANPTQSTVLRRVQLVVTIDSDGIFRFVTVRPIKTKASIADATFHFTRRDQVQIGNGAASDIESRDELLSKRDAYFETCDILRNQLATLLHEKRGQCDETMVDAMHRVVDDDTTKLATLVELLQTMTRVADGSPANILTTDASLVDPSGFPEDTTVKCVALPLAGTDSGQHCTLGEPDSEQH